MPKRAIRKSPSKPDQVTLELLTRAVAFYNHAISHYTPNLPIDRMVAIHGLDNSVEYLLRIIVEHLDIEGRTGKSLDNADLLGLAGEINAFLQKQYKKQLPYLTEIKRLRQVRNLLQHAVVDPGAELERFHKSIDRFFDRILNEVFGVTKEQLRVSSLVRDDAVRKHLEDAESYLQRDPLLSVVASRDAFENAYLRVSSQLQILTRAIPAAVHAERDSFWIGTFISEVREQLELTNLGIELRRYPRYHEYVEHIPSQYRADKSSFSFMERPWHPDEALFCYHFVTDTVLSCCWKIVWGLSLRRKRSSAMWSPVR